MNDDPSTYHCRSCDDVFPAERVRYRTTPVVSEAWGQTAYTYERYARCPECGSEDIDPISLCNLCHVNQPEEGCSACTECIDREESDWDARVARVNLINAKLAYIERCRLFAIEQRQAVRT